MRLGPASDVDIASLFSSKFSERLRIVFERLCSGVADCTAQIGLAGEAANKAGADLWAR
jgi:hypothetical protein